MDTIVVAEHWRSRGVGERLVEVAETLARDAGAKGIRANVLARNVMGQGFYKRMGYEEIAVRFGKSLQGRLCRDSPIHLSAPLPSIEC